MKRVLSYLSQYKKDTVLAPLLKMAEALLELLVPLVMAAIIDRGIANADTPYIIKMSLLLVLIGILGLVMAVAAQYFAARSSVGASTKLRYDLFSHINTLSYSELDSIGDSTLKTRMTNDVNQVQNGINLTLRLLLRSPFVVFGAMIMAFTVDVRASLIFVATIPLLALTVGIIMAITLPMYKRVQGGIDRIFMHTEENLSGVRVIRAFCKEGDELSDFSQSNGELVRRQRRVGAISSLINPMTYVIVNLSVVVILNQSGGRVYSGDLTQGEVIALYNYMSQILVELIKLANLIITVTKAIACAHRIDGAFGVSSSIKSGSVTSGDGDAPAIEMRSASLKYATASEPSVQKISFTLGRGQTLGIIGGTGSGKSSVINLIPRFYDASEGEVYVDGVNVKDYDLSYLRSIIGIVPQKAALFSGTVRDNIRKGKSDATDAEIESAMRVAQAGDILDSKGLDFVIEEGGKNLSGGQKQRLTIARALVRNPKILILDDSSSALDFATDARLRSAISEIGDKSVIIASQRTSAVQNADVILVMHDGRIVAVGEHSELLRSCEIYREIYESQFRREEL